MKLKMKFLTILALGLVVFLANCNIKEPILPTWVSLFEIPIAPQKYLFSEKLANDSTIVTQGDSLYINVGGDIDGQSITAADLTIEGRDSVNSFTLDTLKIDSLDAMSTGYVQITESMPFLPTLLGQTMAVHETTLTASPKIIRSTDFKRAKIRDGNIVLTMTNNLPFTIGPNAASPEGLKVTIINDSTGNHIADVYIPEDIPPGSSASGSAPLGTVTDWIYMPIRLEYSLPVAGDTTFLVTQSLLDTAGYQMDLLFTDLHVVEIVGKIKSQKFHRNWKLNLTGEDKVIQGKIAEGSIELVFNNHLDLGMQIDAVLPDLMDDSGNSYHDQFFVGARSSLSRMIRVDNYTIFNSQNPGAVLDTLLIRLNVTTQKTTDFVHLRDTDEFQASINTSVLSFNSLQGFLAVDTLEISPVTEHNIVDYNGLNSGIQFTGAQLQLDFQNQIDVDSLFLNFTIIGYHRDSDGIYTDSAKLFIEDQPVESGTVSHILLQGPQVDNFLNILPTDLKGFGNIIYGGRAQVEVGDSIGGEYNLFTPMKFRILEADAVEFDPDTLTRQDLDQDVRNAAGDDIRSATLNANIVNRSPLGGELTLIVCADSTVDNIYTTLNQPNSELSFSKSMTLEKSPVDPVSGFTTDSTQNEISFNLTTEQLRIFQNPPIRIGFLLNLEPTGQYVVMRGSDFLEVSGKFNVNVLFRDDN